MSTINLKSMQSSAAMGNTSISKLPAISNSELANAERVSLPCSVTSDYTTYNSRRISMSEFINKLNSEVFPGDLTEYNVIQIPAALFNLQSGASSAAILSALGNDTLFVTKALASLATEKAIGLIKSSTETRLVSISKNSESSIFITTYNSDGQDIGTLSYSDSTYTWAKRHVEYGGSSGGSGGSAPSSITIAQDLQNATAETLLERLGFTSLADFRQNYSSFIERPLFSAVTEYPGPSGLATAPKISKICPCHVYLTKSMSISFLFILILEIRPENPTSAADANTAWGTSSGVAWTDDFGALTIIRAQFTNASSDISGFVKQTRRLYNTAPSIKLNIQEFFGVYPNGIISNWRPSVVYTDIANSNTGKIEVLCPQNFALTAPGYLTTLVSCDVIPGKSIEYSIIDDKDFVLISQDINTGLYTGYSKSKNVYPDNKVLIKLHVDSSTISTTYSSLTITGSNLKDIRICYNTISKCIVAIDASGNVYKAWNEYALIKASTDCGTSNADGFTTPSNSFSYMLVAGNSSFDSPYYKALTGAELKALAV